MSARESKEIGRVMSASAGCMQDSRLEFSPFVDGVEAARSDPSGATIIESSDISCTHAIDVGGIYRASYWSIIEQILNEEVGAWNAYLAAREAALENARQLIGATAE